MGLNPSLFESVRAGHFKYPLSD